LTEAELQTLRIIVHLKAIRTLVRSLYIEMASRSPGGPKQYREKFTALRARPQKLCLTGIDPALSDMAAAEYQRALDELLSRGRAQRVHEAPRSHWPRWRGQLSETEEGVSP
jgi:hypothetical protein